jgi:hypothetical protein
MEAESLAALNAEKAGGQRVFIVGPEGASSTRAIRIRGNLVTYDTVAPANRGGVEADMKVIRNIFGSGGAWLTGTHGNPQGQYGGELSDPKFFARESQFGRYSGWTVKDATKFTDPLSLPGGANSPNVTVYNWCYSSSVPVKPGK